ncbi:MAG: pyrroline-5-carboxylate reductase [Alphaproteobacteria bacterium]|nr:pyrroline-5-carboxylate reductase [Alphaproteobacteria bacterium]
MGGAMLRRWVGLDELAVTVVDPVAAPIDGATMVRRVDDLPDAPADILVIAVKPQMIDQLAPDYAARVAPDGVVASIAAGASIGSIARHFNKARIVRAMPNLPAQIGMGVTAVYSDDALSDAQRRTLDALFGAVGEAVWVQSEDMIDRFTAVAGSGPGYVFEFARVYVAAAEAMGFTPADARRIVLATVQGAAAMALGADDSLEDLRNAVTSKRGTTEAGLNALRQDGALEDLLKATVEAAYARAVALSRGE